MDQFGASKLRAEEKRKFNPRTCGGRLRAPMWRKAAGSGRHKGRSEHCGTVDTQHRAGVQNPQAGASSSISTAGKWSIIFRVAIGLLSIAQFKNVILSTELRVANKAFVALQKN